MCNTWRCALLPAPALGWGLRAPPAGAFSLRRVSFVCSAGVSVSRYALAPALRRSFARYAGRALSWSRASRTLPAPRPRRRIAPALATLGHSGVAVAPLASLRSGAFLRRTRGGGVSPRLTRSLLLAERAAPVAARRSSPRVPLARLRAPSARAACSRSSPAVIPRRSLVCWFSSQPSAVSRSSAHGLSAARACLASLGGFVENRLFRLCFGVLRGAFCWLPSVALSWYFAAGVSPATPSAQPLATLGGSHGLRPRTSGERYRAAPVFINQGFPFLRVHSCRATPSTMATTNKMAKNRSFPILNNVTIS